jgi:hypothetical protein
MVTNWLAHQVTSLKKQVHPRWEYFGVYVLTRVSGDNIEANKLVVLLKELFQNTNIWPTIKQLHIYHLQVVRDPARQYQFILSSLY